MLPNCLNPTGLPSLPPSSPASPKRSPCCVLSSVGLSRLRPRPTISTPTWTAYVSSAMPPLPSLAWSAPTPCWVLLPASLNGPGIRLLERSPKSCFSIIQVWITHPVLIPRLDWSTIFPLRPASAPRPPREKPNPHLNHINLPDPDLLGINKYPQDICLSQDSFLFVFPRNQSRPAPHLTNFIFLPHSLLSAIT